jgi:feruloyl esterase
MNAILMAVYPALLGTADCAAAPRIALPNAHITAASAVPSNDSLRALGEKPYCRVEATVDAETHIVALLPDDWNGRFPMGGGGGYAGSVDNQYASTVHEGYATVGTDAGHTALALLAGWALRNDRRITDYGHRAVHRTAEVTKALIVAYYGRPPSYGYWPRRLRKPATRSMVCETAFSRTPRRARSSSRRFRHVQTT